MKTNKTIIETLKFHDLYGTEIILRMMQKQFKNVLFCTRSIPSAGSACYKSNQLNPEAPVKIIKYILHRNKEITLQTSAGYLRFF